MGRNRPTFEEKAVAEVRALIEAEPGLSRTALSRRVCEYFGWRASNGTLREMGCRVPLRKLERAGRVALPSPRRRMPRKRYRRRNDYRTFRMPDSVMVSLAELGELSLVRVTAGDSELSADILRETPPKPPEPVYCREPGRQPWEQVEFAAADLGDARRNGCLARVAVSMPNAP